MNPVLHGFIYLAALVGVMSVGGMEAAFTMTLGTTIILFMQLDSEQKKTNEIFDFFNFFLFIFCFPYKH